ncbi:MAG TPA: FAD-dependent oxidoreductase [Kofleriaceae bacterium]|nr:FAD-dependent oxidoreductase [Kofleriaceae bacterium]
MTAKKTIVCRCEDVTLGDIDHAIAAGYIDIEEIKRYTGFGTGLCQGKECMAAIATLVAERAAIPADHITPFTARSPVTPTPLCLFSAITPAATDDDAGPAPPREAFPVALKAEPVPARTEVLIIGGGIMGLAIAYNLTVLGATDVTVVEAGYLASGASGRNGGGVRQQWSTELNIRLMRESVDLCRRFATDLGVNVWFRQGGYLFIARTAAERARLEAMVKLQTDAGADTEILSPSEIKSLVGEISTDDVVCAAYNAKDGILFPWPFLWGYARRASERGARLITHTEVTALSREAAGGFVATTSRGRIRADRVVIAAGAWSPEVARLIGISLPTRPVRHEICSSEPLKPFLGPMVSELASGLYFSQSMRGEIVGGVSLPSETPTLAMGSRLAFLETYSRRITKLIPILGGVKILRQWAGPYDLSADGNPILGEVDSVPGLFLCSGFVGHGFMMAPRVGQLYASLLAGKERHEIFDRFPLSRFSDGASTSPREDFNIG